MRSMSLKGTFLLVGSASLLTACLHTHIEHEVFSSAHTACHHLMVCSMAQDPNRAERLETMMRKRLHRYQVETESCSTWMAAHETQSADEKQALLLQQGFDGILIMRRVSPRVEVVPETPAQNPAEYVTPKAFFEAYAALPRRKESREPQAPIDRSAVVPQRVITGEAELLGLKKNEVLWAIGGIVAGSPKDSLDAFMRAAVSRTETELRENGLIPEK